MDTEKEDILAIYINLINMVEKWTSSFQYETIAGKKKDTQNILLLQTNDKYIVVKRKPVVSEQSPNLFLYIHTYICIG